MSGLPLIGILGARGTAGQACVQALLRDTSFTLRLGGRDAEKGAVHTAQLGSRVHFVPVDIQDAQALKNFVCGCQLVINCAGPSRLILDTVARAALQAGCHYLDLAGDEVLYQRTEDLHVTLYQKRLCCLLSIGIFPGLSGLFLDYCLQEGDSRAQDTSLFFANCGEAMSQTAALDIVYSLRDGFGLGMHRLQNGQVVRDNAGPQLVNLPFFRESLALYPSLNYECQRVATRRRTPNLRCCVSMPSHTMQTLFQIRAAESWQHPTEVEQSARQLAAASLLDCKDFSPFTWYQVKAKGEQNGEYWHLDAELIWNKPSVQLVGRMIAITVQMIISEHYLPGRYLFHESLDIPEFFRLLTSGEGAPRLSLHMNTESLEIGYI